MVNSLRKNILLFFSVFLYTVVSGQENLAIIDFTGKGISAVEASALTDRLQNELLQLVKYKLVERELIEDILFEQGLQQSGCTTNECIIEIGKLLGVDKIIGGSISKVGNIYSIYAKIISVETGEIIITSTYDYEGDIEHLLIYGMKYIAYDICELNPPNYIMKANATIKKLYIEGLENFQSSNYDRAIDIFNELLNMPLNELTDNAQYWIAECYYSQKKYDKAIEEFEKVLSYSNSEKDDDAQLKLGLANDSLGNIDKAREEYLRIILYYPSSEYYYKAKMALKDIDNKKRQTNEKP